MEKEIDLFVHARDKEFDHAEAIRLKRAMTSD